MLLIAVTTKDELEAIIHELTPISVVIDERRGRAVTLGRPHTIELVPNRGLRLGGDACITWDLAGVGIPVTVEAWQVLLVPRIASRGRSRIVVLEPEIETLDLRLVPDFVADKIADAMDDALSKKRDKLAWNFSRALSKRLPLSAKLSPARGFEMDAEDGSVTVTATEIRLLIRLSARIVEVGAAGRPKPHEGAPARGSEGRAGGARMR